MEKKEILFGLGEPNDAYAQYFDGQSYLNRLTETGGPMANVTFEPGCRNHWHIHHKSGQILLCTMGRGYYQEWGKPAQELKQVILYAFLLKLNIGMELLKIAGLHIFLLKSLLKILQMNG